MITLDEYIKENLKKCIRENTHDSGTLLGVPYPYIVPSTEHFDELYYWDTYFANIGLLKCGMHKLAKDNVDNMLYLVDKYGFMPNGNRTYYLNHSQPPLLSEMVRDIYNHFCDDVWLRGAYGALVKEYSFWMEKRSFNIGLNYYDSDVPLGREKDFAAGFVKRIGFKPRIGDYDLARHALATSESGWDMNPRCKFDLYNYATVDLNSLLYGFERNMAYFAKKLKKYTDEITWKSRSKERLENMNSYMLNDENVFLDYNFVTGKKSDVFSVASYFAMFTKAANEKQAKTLVDNLPKLEEKYGISTCEKRTTNIDYQWDYPNGWACLQYIMIRGLENYGYHDDAVRISRKYVELVEKVFAETQNLWEKYNVVEGNINVSNEYKMPTMLGWSAGVYIFAKDFLKCTASKSIV